MTKLEEYKEKYQTALAAYAGRREKFGLWQKQFDGDRDIPGGKPATSIYNFTRELIEAQIDSSLPQPSVQPRRPSERSRELAENITAMLRSELDRLPFEQLNDLDERVCRIMSGDVYLTEWDNGYKTHDAVGAVNVRLVSPMEIVPQQAVYELDAMDYLFLVFDDTKSRIKARYGKDVTDETTDGAVSSETPAADDVVTQKICFYKNAKGGIGCISWVGDTELISDDYYYARKDKICGRCGKTRPLGEKTCECGGGWVKRPKDYETLTQDISRSDGVVIPAMSPVRDEAGGFVTEEYETQELDPETGLPVFDYVFQDGMAVGEQPRMTAERRVAFEPTRIPYYYPRSFPIAVRKNVSAYQEFFGDSDCGAIREQQLQANKAMTKLDGKIAAASEFFTKPEDLSFKITNDGARVLNVRSPADIAMIRALSLEFGTAGEYAVIEHAYQTAKSILGVSDTFQGKADPTATSGRAKEIQVAQAAGIQKSKRVMKNAAYSRLFENMFKFMLAYPDEPRAYTAMDENGRQVEKVFSRYDFLEQDEYGSWHYNDDFLFSVDEAGAMQTDRQFLLEDVRTDLGLGAFGNPTEPQTMLMYWKEKETLGYPNAKRMVKYWQDKAEAQRAEMQMQQEQQAAMLEAQRQQQSGGGFGPGAGEEIGVGGSLGIGEGDGVGTGGNLGLGAGGYPPMESPAPPGMAGMGDVLPGKRMPTDYL